MVFKHIATIKDTHTHTLLNLILKMISIVIVVVVLVRFFLYFMRNRSCDAFSIHLYFLHQKTQTRQIQSYHTTGM